MRANQFHSWFLTQLETNLSSKSSNEETIKSLVINFYISFHMVCLAVMPSIYYFIVHFHETTDLFIALFQIPAFISCTWAYINLCFRKKIVNEILVDFEAILDKRKAYIENEGRYKKSAELAEKLSKYPMITLVLGVYSNIMLMIAIDIDKILRNGEMNVKEWFFPYRYMYVLLIDELKRSCKSKLNVSGIRLRSTHSPLIVCRSV